MAKDIKVGDVVTLRWTVTKVWPEDGDISMTHPLVSNPITISGNEIKEGEVERKPRR